MKHVFFFAFFFALASIHADSVRFFADRNENFGVPDGLFELPQKQAERGFHYRFRYDDRNRVVRIESRLYRVLTEDMFNLSIVEFEYDAGGKLVKRIYKNPAGKTELVWNYPSGPDCIVFSDPCMTDHKSNDFIPFPDDFLQDTTDADDGNTLCGKIGGLRLFRDAKNRVTRIQYRRDNDSAIGSDVFRTCGQEYELDEHGRFHRVYLLDRDGKRKADGWGVASYRLTSKGPWFASLETFGSDGKPINCNRGFAVHKNEVNADGNNVRESFFGADGEPVMNRSSRASVVVVEYDAQTAMPVRRMSYGTDGKPCADSNGAVSIDIRCDADGRCVENILHTIDGLPPNPENRIPGEIIRKTYDGAGRIVRLECRSAADDDVVFIQTFDPEPVNGIQSFVRFDGQGNVTAKAIKEFDSNGLPRSVKRLFANREKPEITLTRYDRYGTLLERFNVGEGGFRRELDADGMVVKEFDLDEKQQIESGVEMTYDACGGLKSMRFLKPSEDGGFVYEKSPDGVWEIRYRRDERGNETEQAFYDLSGKPVGMENGEDKPIFRVKKEYDSRGNRIRLEFLQEDGSPVMCEDNGYSSVQESYDSRDNVIATCWFSPDMMPFPHPFPDSGEDMDLEHLPATVRKTFDAADRIVEINLFAPEAPGNLYGIRNAFRICHKTLRNAEGEITVSSAYDADDKQLKLGKNISYIRIGTDRNGRKIYQEFQDANGKPVMSDSAGFASFRLLDGVKHFYDAEGKEIPPPAESPDNEEEEEESNNEDEEDE